MTDKRAIAVGDLVQIVRPSCRCGKVTSIGRIFRVAELSDAPTRCVHCNSLERTITARHFCDPLDGKWWSYPLHCLKRIPPLEELDGKRTEEKTKEKV